MPASTQKKSKKKVIIFSIAAVVVILLVLLVILGSKRETVVTVQTEKVTRRTVTQTVTATGKIYPEVSVDISPEVSGEIIQLPVKEGYVVKKGDVLMKIKPDIYMAQRDQAAASVLSAKASMDRAQSEWKRNNDLSAKGLVATSDLELAKMNFDVATANYDQAKASLDQSEESLRKTTIVAPMDGTISQLNVELGQRVLGTSQFQGTDVMTVSDLSRMEARINVSENDVVDIQNGDTARIVVDAYPDKKYIGIVYQIANTATTTGAGTQEEVTNFEVRMRIKDDKSTLRPGMSMTATVETQTKQNVLTVPIQSVTARSTNGTLGMGAAGTQQGDQGKGQSESDEMAKADTRIKQQVQKTREVVFIVDNGVAKEVEVKRGIADDQYVEIVSGTLPEGKEVVSGSYKAINRELDNSVKVKVDNMKKPANGDKKEAS